MAVILILLVFYSIYIGKMLLQRKRGIRTEHIAKREKRDKIFYTEFIIGTLLGIAGDTILPLLW